MSDVDKIVETLGTVVEEHAIWCSFCNAEPSCGEITIQLDELQKLPIGPLCIAQAKDEGLDIELLDSLH